MRWLSLKRSAKPIMKRRDLAVFKSLLCGLAMSGLIPVANSWAAAGLAIAWTNNHLTVAGPNLPGKTLDIWYLEAFCRSNSTHQNWGQTTIPHRTQLLSANWTHLRFEIPDVQGLPRQI